ncbi:hypothetical protein LXA43DRAFT_840880, partial [Ganoderma leucocontextum]
PGPTTTRSEPDVPTTGPCIARTPTTTCKTMNPVHNHYALLAYAQEMHQYTLELWTEFSKKAQQPARGPVLPSNSDSSSTVNSSLPRGGAVSDDSEARSPQN